MRGCTIFILLVLYFIYLAIGAAIFWAIEFQNEEDLCLQTIAQLERYNLSDINSNVQFENGSLSQLVNLLLTLNENGVQINQNRELSCAHNWDYQNSFFFAGTVITTIGYGHISPSTEGGRIFCIFFAAIGLPIFAMMFSEIGSMFADLFSKLEDKYKYKIASARKRKILTVLILLTTMIIFALLIPSAIFTAAEQWTYNEAFYYSFITLTTIGFGDYVVGINPDITYIQIYRIMVYFWILFGLAFMAAVISTVSDIIKKKAKVEEKRKDKSNDNSSNNIEDVEKIENEKKENQDIQVETNIPMTPAINIKSPSPEINEKQNETWEIF